MRVYVEGVSVWGPGLEGWVSSMPALTGAAPYLPSERPPPPADILPANERRRAGAVTRLALWTAQQACEQARRAPDTLPSVFGSSNGDAVTVQRLVATVTSADTDVSPTLFHNSVHNATAGYWSIAAGSAQPCNSIGGHDHTVAAALLSAATTAVVDQVPVLLCVYDAPCPEPLDAKRPTAHTFSFALVLGPEQSSRAQAVLDLAFRGGPAEAALLVPTVPELAELSRRNPSAQGLRLLELLARREPGAAALTYLESHLKVEFTPC